MRLGVFAAWAFTGWCSLGACSGGYPLPPTACDEYCNATLGESCPEFYNPAGCVSSCEQNHSAPPECRTELDAVIACYNQHPELVGKRCSFSAEPVTTCAVESLTLRCCANRSEFDCSQPVPTL
jgi:hypothetical protein